MPIKRPRPLKRRRRVPPELTAEVPSGETLQAFAANARYLGSGEHKGAPWEDIRPNVKNADASKCPTWIKSRGEATAMLRTGILAGNISAEQVGGMPQRVWYKGKKGVFEARLTDRADPKSQKPAGYKAWPEEDPDNLPSRPRPIRACDET
jgi:hypothetical protein